MIIAVAHTKGGVGKSVIACNLAVWRSGQGRDVILVDGDEQASSSGFMALRSEQLKDKTGFTGVQLPGQSLRSQVRQLAEKYEDVIIDIGGSNNPGLRAALTVAHRVLIPCTPRTLDVWAMEKLSEVLSEAKALNEKLYAMAFISMADPSGQGSDNEDARAAIREVPGVDTVLSTMIGRRKSFPNALAQGRGVIEARPRDSIAVNELDALASASFEDL